jgi:ABC-type transporter Mla subunit MlaD
VDDLLQRVERIESVLSVIAATQRSLAESLRAVVESANENASNANENFTAIVRSLEQICQRLREDADDADDWWRQPHD